MNLPEFEKHPNNWKLGTPLFHHFVMIDETEYNAIRDALADKDMLELNLKSARGIIHRLEKSFDEATAVLNQRLLEAEQQRDELRKKLAIAESIIDFELLTELGDRYAAITKAEG